MTKKQSETRTTRNDPHNTQLFEALCEHESHGVLGRALAQSLDMTGVVHTMSVPSTGIVSKHFTTTHNLRWRSGSSKYHKITNNNSTNLNLWLCFLPVTVFFLSKSFEGIICGFDPSLHSFLPRWMSQRSSQLCWCGWHRNFKVKSLPST